MRRLMIVLAVLAVAAVSPAAALGKAKGTDRPWKGQTTSTTTLDLATGTGTSDGAGQASHLGAFTFHNDHSSFTLTGSDFSFTLTATYVAANGDKLFATGVATGTLLSATTSEATLLSTITGGTGRFADASGTITSHITSEIVSVGTTLTTRDTETHEGRISY